MIYSEFQGEQLSLLGFGTMRLPLTGPEPGSPVDEAQVAEMTAWAIAHGVNYFDTAYPYHGGESERIIGRVLRDYPRDQFKLATKYPGHQISSSYDPAATFEEQLQKCGVDYFDFYLLHNVNESSTPTYMDPRWGIVDYFLEQKARGRIRHLGFSFHGGMDNLHQFLDRYGDVMEFCQIQLNYLDWSLQDAKAKYELLTERGIPVWVMEPVRGGRLADLSADQMARLEALHPGRSAAAWALQFLQGLSNVKMVLSGMSDLAQMKENVETFSARRPLLPEELQQLFAIGEEIKNAVPCTSCRYCCAGCPKGLDIPMLLGVYNEIRLAPGVNLSMRMEALPREKWPSACIGCGKCTRSCPQKIEIPALMQQLDAELQKLPSWTEICRQREAAARKNAGRSAAPKA